jgi:hypothetical protein
MKQEEALLMQRKIASAAQNAHSTRWIIICSVLDVAVFIGVRHEAMIHHLSPKATSHIFDEYVFFSTFAFVSLILIQKIMTATHGNHVNPDNNIH